MPAYFKHYGRRDPSGQHHTIYSFAAGDPPATIWEIMNRNSELMEKFMATMSAMAGYMGDAAAAYDLSWVVTAAKDADPSRALVVDIGGGRGHSLEAICKATPGLDISRCVVQDLPKVLEEAKSLAGGRELAKARFVSMDFHAEQPVRGALLYHTRLCIHDYSDEDCIRMLRHIRGAMLPDSRLLIVDQVLDNPPSAVGAANDLFMAVIGGKERTEAEFRDITVQAGLEVKGVFKAGGAYVGVVECVPV